MIVSIQIYEVDNTTPLIWQTNATQNMNRTLQYCKGIALLGSAVCVG